MTNLVGLVLQTFPLIGGGSLGEFFGRYNDLIVYTIPFILIFAVVYGILYKAKIFGENKGVNAIIGLSIAGLALWEGSVIQFFSVIFPNLGIAIAVLLGMVILLGLFMSFEKSNIGSIILFFFAMLLGLIVILSSLSDYNWWGSYWWQNWGGLLIIGLIIIIVVGILMATGKQTGKPSRYSFLVPNEGSRGE